ncbi:MAG: 3-isopropylmalate dehydratase small subunit [Actinomycetia bacterium]|nr:3-isopropylmalate dehydratase small subunit [Actinomycetes bacterium]
MPETLVQGRVWRFGNDISTDVLSPGTYAVAPLEIRKLHVLESVNPVFASECQPGDVIVGGSNFGCGSSRETAPENLKAVGVACVVAESLARIFMRNAVAVGLPVLVCEGVHDVFEEGQVIAVDLATGAVTNRTTGDTYQGDSLPEEMRTILSAGGILEVLRTRANG